MVTKEGRVREKVEGREEERQGIWEAEWEGKPCPLALDYISQSHRVQDTAFVSSREFGVLLSTEDCVWRRCA